jgi:hypothetical protein
MTADLSADLLDSGVPLSIHDATWALYATDDDDAVLAQLGAGFVEKVLLDGDYPGRALQFQGRRFSGRIHEDENHTIELTRPLLVAATGERTAATNLPALMRNRRCGLVLRTWDPAELVWWKRSYFGVSLQPSRIHADGGKSVEQVFHATLRMRAERMAESEGSGPEPDLSLVSTGELRYVDGSGSVTLYNYNGGEFQPVDEALLAGRATVDFDGTPGAILFRFDGTPALRLDAGGLHATSFDFTGPTYGTGTRLEFWVNGTRRGTLQADGTFIAPTFTDTDPEDDSAMRFPNDAGIVLLALGPSSVYAPAFGDDL